MILGKFVKQPAEREMYAIEYEDDLSSSDTIAPAPVVSIAVIGPGTDLDPLRIDAVDVTGTRVTLWVAAGTNRLTYKVTVTASTLTGRILQDEFIVKIKDF